MFGILKKLYFQKFEKKNLLLLMFNNILKIQGDGYQLQRAPYILSMAPALIVSRPDLEESNSEPRNNNSPSIFGLAIETIFLFDDTYKRVLAV